MEKESKPKPRKKAPQPNEQQEKTQQSNPRKYGTLSSPISFGVGIGSVNLNTSKKPETNVEQSTVPVPSIPITSNLGMGVVPHLAQLPVRPNPEVTLGGVRKVFVPLFLLIQ